MDESVDLVDLNDIEPSKKSIVRAEVNLINFPFFVLSKQAVRKQSMIEYRYLEEKGGQKLERHWIVFSNPEVGHPSAFDKKVFRGIEAIIDKKKNPLKNPITFTTYELLKEMGEEIGGWQYQKIRDSIKRIIATTIDAKETFYRKKTKSWVGEIFHIYERCIYQGEKLENGQIAEQNYLYLHPLYLESLNARYVKPLDYEYYKKLERPLSQRLYEFLSYKFYGAFKNNAITLLFNYSTLCQLLPIKEQRFLSDAIRYLEPAHNELIETNFLAGVEWVGWQIYYHAGQRAFDEFRSLNSG